MINWKLSKSKAYEVVLLGVFASFCFLLSVARVYFSGEFKFLFLIWNLFLAFIPWLISTFVVSNPQLVKNWKLGIVIFLCWLLIFPNAPYILTDLLHLKYARGMPMWYDMLLILTYAWTGLLAGLLSLFDVKRLIEVKLDRVGMYVFFSLLMFVISFGIYIGRFLRWNSWDILTHPLRLVLDVGDRFLHPFQHPRSWGVTILMGLFLNMVFWTFNFVRKMRYSLPD